MVMHAWSTNFDISCTPLYWPVGQAAEGSLACCQESREVACRQECTWWQPGGTSEHGHDCGTGWCSVG
eukprot:126882-Chlamydomonas_euryale.AAC.1